MHLSTKASSNMKHYFLLIAVLLVFFVMGSKADIGENTTIVEPTISPPQRGNCTFWYVMKNGPICQWKLYQSFQQAPQANCSVQYLDFHACVDKLYTGCYGALPSRPDPKLMHQMCSSFPGYYPIFPKHGINETEGSCNKTSLYHWTTSLTYMRDVNKCSAKAQQMFSENRGDPRLCREYVKVKKCSKEAAYKWCAPTGDAKKRLEVMPESFNPFCASGRDPAPSTAPHIITLNCRLLAMTTFVLWLLKAI